MGAVIKATPKSDWNVQGSACAGKAVFDDRRVAEAVAERIRRRERAKGLVIYTCSYCHRLHIGTKK